MPQLAETRQALEEKFRRLVIEWKTKRGPLSSSAKLAMHPAYQKIAKEETLEAFSEAFAIKGFVRCSDGKVELGFEKIAVYALGSEIRHAAKQMKDGSWRSKLGPDEDIEHILAGLEGPLLEQ